MARPKDDGPEKKAVQMKIEIEVIDMLDALKKETGINKNRLVEDAIRLLHQQHFPEGEV